MSPLDTTPKTLTFLVPQSTIDRVLKDRAEKAKAESRLNEEIPEFEEEVRSRGIGPLLFVGIIVTSLLAFSGLQVANSHAPATLSNVAVSSGNQTMSAAELIQSVNAAGRIVYWLAPRSGDTYSISTTSNGIDQVSYYPEGSSISSLNQYSVSIATYKDLATYNANTHPFLGANSRTDVLSNGMTVTYNSISPTQAFVAFPDVAQKVVISYPSIQPVPTILNDAQNLLTVK